MIQVQVFEVKDGEPWNKDMFPKPGHYWWLASGLTRVTYPTGPFPSSGAAHHDAYLAAEAA